MLLFAQNTAKAPGPPSRRIVLSTLATSQQPQFAAFPEYGNPLVKGIAFLAAGSTQDAVAGISGAITGTQPPTLKYGINGAQFTFVTTSVRVSSISYQASQAPVDIFGLGNPGTVHMLIRATAFNCGLLGKSDQNTSAGWVLGLNASGQLDFHLTGAANSAITSSASVPLNTFCLISVVQTTTTAGDGTAVFYINGIPAGVSGTSFPNSSGHTTDAPWPLTIGSAKYQFPTDFNGDIAFVSMHKRGHAAFEVAAVAANPWQLFKATVRSLFTNSPLYPSRGIFLESFTKTAQPQYPAQIDPSLRAGLWFAYHPPVSLVRAIEGLYPAGSNSTPAKILGLKGVSGGFNGAQYVLFNGTNAAPISGGLSILIVCRYTTNPSAGGAVVIDRGRSNTSSGLTLQLYNTGTTPTNKLLTGYYKQGVGADQPYDALYVDGIPTANNTFLTNLSQYYTIAFRLDAVGSDAASIALGASVFYNEFLTGDVALAFVWDAKLSNATLQNLSANPWQVFK